jgi:methylglutaconyl-CoA hydratase
LSSSALIVEHLDDAIAVLTLNRPERRNALTVELMQSLCCELESLAAQPGRRVAIFRGAGAMFCSGLDLVETAEASVAEEAAEWVARMLQAVVACPLVTIAAAHGGAYAGGTGLMASCDLVVAADDLRIGFPEVRRGLVPAVVAATLHGRVPLGVLTEITLLGEPVEAQRALSLGLVHRVVPGDRLLAEARALAAAIVKGAPDAVRQTKRLLRDLESTEPSQRLSRAMEFHKRARRSDEAREGLAAFRERREPDWTRCIQ